MHPSVQWLDQADFATARQNSRRVNRPILLDFHDPTLPACQRLETFIYADPEVIKAIADFAIPLRVVTTESDHTSLAIINCYISISTPTVQLLSPEATVYHAWQGAPRLTVLCARQIAGGKRRVYLEAAGSLSPRLFLAQLMIGCGKAALKQRRFEEAMQLFQRVVPRFVDDQQAVAEARYWESVACSGAKSCIVGSEAYT